MPAVKKSELKSSDIYSLKKGAFSVRSQEGEEGAELRIAEWKDATGASQKKEIWEINYGELSGKLTGMSIFSGGQFGDNLFINLDDDITMSLPVDSREFGQFAKTLPNIDLSQDIYFSAYIDKTTGYGKMSISQIGVDGRKTWVDWAYTRENPNGMPDAVKTMKKGKEVWDFSAQEEFLYQKIVEFMNQNFAPKTFAAGETQQQAESALASIVGDLPFASSPEHVQVGGVTADASTGEVVDIDDLSY